MIYIITCRKNCLSLWTPNKISFKEGGQVFNVRQILLTKKREFGKSTVDWKKMAQKIV